jgi:hypothetical protein
MGKLLLNVFKNSLWQISIYVSINSQKVNSFFKKKFDKILNGAS